MPLPYSPHEIALAPVLSGILQGRAHHANLWTGPDGVGKFLWAQALARVALCLNCIQTPSEACNCNSCMHKEGHPDLLILGPEPAGLKIEAMRELTAKCALKPMLSRRRIVIVRDMHLMTVQAQNAFLKTLEEPPGQTVFFLLTHQDRKLLRTIRSRCQQVRFAPLDHALLEHIHKDALAALPAETIPGLVAAAAGSAAQLGRLIAACAGDDALARPLAPLLRAPLRERLAAVDAFAESQDTTTIAAMHFGLMLAQWARTGNDEQRKKAVARFDQLQTLIARAEGNGNRKLLWERWFLG